MIRTELVDEIPRDIAQHLAMYSRKEYEQAKAGVSALEAQALEIAMVYEGDTPLVLIGLSRASLLGVPDFWFLLCEGFARRHLRLVKRYVREMLDVHRRFKTYIEDDFIAGVRFAKFAGFHKTNVTANVLGRTYHLYEARR